MNAITPLHGGRRGPRSTCWAWIGDQGAGVDLLAPDWTPIRLTDLATSLSRIPWRGGATRGAVGYSLAQRAAWLASAVHDATHDPRLARAALLRDAHLSALGGVPTAIARAIGTTEVEALERRLSEPLLRRFGAPPVVHHRAIREAEALLTATELRDLVPGGEATWRGPPLPPPHPARLVPLPCTQAHARFVGVAAALGMHW